MKLSHAEAMKAKAAADTAETLRKIEERLTAIEKMLQESGSSTPKRSKKSDAEQAAPPQPEA